MRTVARGTLFFLAAVLWVWVTLLFAVGAILSVRDRAFGWAFVGLAFAVAPTAVALTASRTRRSDSEFVTVKSAAATAGVCVVILLAGSLGGVP